MGIRERVFKSRRTVTKHLITRGAEHGVFDIETACGLTVECIDKTEKGVGEFEEVDCGKCLNYIAAKHPLCVVCGTNRAGRRFCNPCCRKHFDEQKAKYPGLNPMYWDPMPREVDHKPSDEYLEMKRKAKERLGYK
jgi:hypothetical protein